MIGNAAQLCNVCPLIILAATPDMADSAADGGSPDGNGVPRLNRLNTVWEHMSTIKCGCVPKGYMSPACPMGALAGALRAGQEVVPSPPFVEFPILQPVYQGSQQWMPPGSGYTGQGPRAYSLDRS